MKLKIPFFCCTSGTAELFFFFEPLLNTSSRSTSLLIFLFCVYSFHSVTLKKQFRFTNNKIKENQENHSNSRGFIANCPLLYEYFLLLRRNAVYLTRKIAHLFRKSLILQQIFIFHSKYSFFSGKF